MTTFFPNAVNRQRAVFVHNLLRAMMQRCHIEVIAPVPYAPPFGNNPAWREKRSIPATEWMDGLQVVHPRFVVVPKVGWLSGLGYFLGIVRTLRRIVKDRKGVVIHAHCAYPDAVGVALAAALLRLPFLVTAHGSDINVYARQPLLRPQIRWALRRAIGVVAVSRSLEARIAALIGTDATSIACIPCAAYDTTVFFPRPRQQARTALQIAPHARVVLFVGMLVPVKGLEFLVDAWIALQRAGKVDATDRLVLLGEGLQRKLLAERIAEVGMAESVLFGGAVTQAEVATWMSAATLLCLPSRNEGTPNVIVEALACGIPVVASAVGGIPDLLVEGETGLLVPPADVVALSNALARAFEQPWDAKRIADSVANRTWRRIADLNCDFIQTVRQQP
ncbi:glycosyltransferase [Actimicrobium sp. GrIS 1.19]|uniref:glycosyltransferase n=1 Tax=Actimicrobium sp. GrIS 1.19 TaxID=3071708 RepID=UPI002E153D39